jgi:hypothetical protein
MPILDVGIDSAEALRGADQYEDAADKIVEKTDDITEKTDEATKGFFSLKDGMVLAFGAVVLSSMMRAAEIMAGFASKAISAASDFEEVEQKFNAVFAGMEGDAAQFSKVLESSYAMSMTESRGFLSSVQDLLVPMGMARTEAGSMSFEIVKLAADLSSFNNLPTADVMNSITSALSGNYESMKKFGIILNENTIKQEAMNMGMGDSVQALSLAEKAQVVYSLMVKGSADALGDLDKSSGSYSLQLKALNAGIENFTIKLGQQLLPYATQFISYLNDWVSNQENVTRVLMATTNAAQFLYNGVKGIELALRGLVLVAASVFDAVYQKIMVILSPVDQLFDGLVKLGAMDNNPLQMMKRATEDFAASALEGFQKVWKETETMHNKFEASKAALLETAQNSNTLTRAQTDLANAASLAGAGIALETDGLYGYMSAQQIAEAQTNGTTLAMGAFIEESDSAAGTVRDRLNPAIDQATNLYREQPGAIDGLISANRRFRNSVDDVTASVYAMNQQLSNTTRYPNGPSTRYPGAAQEAASQTTKNQASYVGDRYAVMNAISNSSQYLGPTNLGSAQKYWDSVKDSPIAFFGTSSGKSGTTININQNLSRSDVTSIISESQRQTIRG